MLLVRASALLHPRVNKRTTDPALFIAPIYLLHYDIYQGEKDLGVPSCRLLLFKRTTTIPNTFTLHHSHTHHSCVLPKSSDYSPPSSAVVAALLPSALPPARIRQRSKSLVLNPAW